jgi:formate hydrogenlyase subunit 3/multisubunit Na+/H+ antiporter MnhD subunit
MQSNQPVAKSSVRYAIVGIVAIFIAFIGVLIFLTSMQSGNIKDLGLGLELQIVALALWVLNKK